jgi:hypothetical protein
MFCENLYEFTYPVLEPQQFFRLQTNFAGSARFGKMQKSSSLDSLESQS